MDFMDGLGGLLMNLQAEQNGTLKKLRVAALTTKVGDYTVDTCYTVDAGYETGLWKGRGCIVIVEYYKNYDASVSGHEKWCEWCKSNPTSVVSVQTGDLEEL